MDQRTTTVYASTQGLVRVPARTYAADPLLCRAGLPQSLKRGFGVARLACGIIFALDDVFYMATTAFSSNVTTCFVLYEGWLLAAAVHAAADGVCVYKLAAAHGAPAMDAWRPRASSTLTYAASAPGASRASGAGKGTRRVPLPAHDCWIPELDGAPVRGLCEPGSSVDPTELGNWAFAGLLGRAGLVPFDAVLDLVRRPQHQTFVRPRIALRGGTLCIDQSEHQVKDLARTRTPQHALGEFIRLGADLSFWDRSKRAEGVLSM